MALKKPKKIKIPKGKPRPPRRTRATQELIDRLEARRKLNRKKNKK